MALAVVPRPRVAGLSTQVRFGLGMIYGLRPGTDYVADMEVWGGSYGCVQIGKTDSNGTLAALPSIPNLSRQLTNTGSVQFRFSVYDDNCNWYGSRTSPVARGFATVEASLPGSCVPRVDACPSLWCGAILLHMSTFLFVSYNMPACLLSPSSVPNCTKAPLSAGRSSVAHHAFIRPI